MIQIFLRVALSALVLLAVPCAVEAQAAALVSSGERSNLVWTANGIARLLDTQTRGDGARAVRHGDAVLIALVNRMAEEQVLPSGAERGRLIEAVLHVSLASAECTTRRRGTDAAPDPDAIAECLLGAAAGRLGERYIPFLRAEVGRFVADMRHAQVAAGHIATSAERANAFAAYAAGQLDSAWAVAATSNGANQVLVRTFESALSAAPREAANRVLNRNPALRAVVSEMPSLRSTIESGRLPTTAAVSTDAAGFITRRLDLGPQGERVLGDLLQARDRSDVARAVGNERAAVFLASSVARLTGNEDAARAISTIGEAAVNIREMYSTASQLASFGSTAASLATMANGVGIAMGIAGFLGGGGFKGLMGGGGDAATASALRAIGKQIRAMHEEMRRGFANVDAKLDRILAENTARFDRLDAALARLDASTQASFADVQQSLSMIHSELAEIQMQLGTIQLQMERLLESVANNLPEDVQRRCLDPVFAGEIAHTTFQDCVYRFEAAALNSIDPTGGAFVPAQLPDETLRRLGDTTSLAREFPFLAAVASMHGNQALRDVGIRPGQWRRWSLAYAQTMLKWPAQAQLVVNPSFESLEAHGVRARNALAGLAWNGGRPDTMVYASIAERYALRVDSLVSLLDSLALSFERQRYGRANVFGGGRPAGLAFDTLPTRARTAYAPPVPPGSSAPRPLALHRHASLPWEVREALHSADPQVTVRLEVSRTGETRRENNRTTFNSPGPIRIPVSAHNVDVYYRTIARTRFLLSDGREVAWFADTLPAVHMERERIVIVLNRPTPTPSWHQRARAHGVGDPFQRDQITTLNSHWPTLTEAGPAPAVDSAVLAALRAAVDSVRAQRRAEFSYSLNDFVTRFRDQSPTEPAQLPRGEWMRLDQAGRLWRLLRDLDADVALLEAFVRLGMPRSFASDTSLRAVLRGPERAYDRLALAQALDPARPGQSGLVEAWRSRSIRARADRLRQVLRASQVAMTGPEYDPEIDITLRELCTARRIHALPRLTTPCVAAPGAPAIGSPSAAR